jgi:biopolymer transport protein TolR
MVSTKNQRSGRRQMSFDLNLVPFIDILSTCICFLLITAVFMQLGTVNVKQAIGDSTSKSENEPPSVWLKMQDSGAIEVTVKNLKVKGSQGYSLKAIREGVDFNSLETTLAQLKTTHPQLDTALVLPSASSRYEDVIQIMDLVKRGQIAQVGIAPL